MTTTSATTPTSTTRSAGIKVGVVGKGGVCGTCRALVTHGEVRMRRNFALEKAEVDAGYVLTCQALPLSESVIVDFDS